MARPTRKLFPLRPMGVSQYGALIMVDWGFEPYARRDL
jgi:hypothetical protein